MEGLHGRPGLESGLSGLGKKRQARHARRLEIPSCDRFLARRSSRHADSPPRTFELRTYTTTPGNLAASAARFRDHTMALFTKHGMTNVGYWSLDPDQKGAADTLIYMLAHKSKEARDASFKSFGSDRRMASRQVGLGKSRRWPADHERRRGVGLPHADRLFADEVAERAFALFDRGATGRSVVLNVAIFLTTVDRRRFSRESGGFETIAGVEPKAIRAGSRST